MEPMDGDLTSIPYQPTSTVVEIPDHFPEMVIPADNPMTLQGIELGRRLFFDPILSSDGTMSCSSCHMPSGAFTDNLAVSTGVLGNEGRRSSMSLLNIGFNNNGFFWDGRTLSLEEQALLPIEDPLELNETWGNVETKLRDDEIYPALFRRAFGIASTQEITRELAAKAIAQFERTLVSSGNSKYDRVVQGLDVFSDEELRGHDIFFDIDPDISRHAECGHCHNAPLFTTNEYFNNGIDQVTDLTNFLDIGRGEVTSSIFDNGTFRVPTLRAIEFTAPYMHDGRFSTLDEVIDHYVTGGHPAQNLAPVLRELNLEPEDRTALKAFIETLADEDFLTNPSFLSPF